MKYQPQSFWERSHSQVKEEDMGLGEGIRHVGGGTSILEAKYLYKLRLRALQRVIGKLIPQIAASRPADPLKIFEFGCGSGFWIQHFSNILSPIEIKYFGSDISKTAVARLQYRHPDFFFACMENAQIGWERIFEKAPFDISLAIDVLYHITEDRIWRESLGNIAKSTKLGGFFIFNDLGYSQANPCPSKSHVKHRPLQTYLDELEAGGFEVIHIEPVFFLFDRIKYGPFRDHSKPMAALWRLADRFPFFLRMLFLIDCGVTQLLRPLDARCKNRFFLCKKI